MRIAMRSTFFLLALAAGVVPGCSDGGAPADPPRRAQAAEAAPPRDLAAVMRRVHFAFRADGPAFTGGHTNYEARAEGGEIRVTPVAPASPTGPRAARSGAPFVARTEGARRGGETIFASHARDRAALAADGGIEIDRRGAVEHLRNTEHGVEQSWTFAERPHGDGDLAVRVRVSGERYLGATAGGHHFVDPETTLGVRYGEATWVDARGTRSRLPVRWDGEALEITVPGAVIDASAYPAELDPTIGPESGMDDPVTVPATSGQYTPAIAWGPGASLAVWSDWRQTISDLYGARIAPDGTVLDPNGILLCNATGSQGAPAVASDGTRWLVVWEDTRSSSEIIYGARVDANGVVLEPNGVKLQSTFYGKRPAVASDGTNFLVAWDDSFNGFDTNANVRAARVSAAGTILDPTGFVVSSAANGQLDPAIGWNGTNYFVAWSDARTTSNVYQIYGSRVTSAGTVLDPSGLPINTTETYSERGASVASDGQGFFVAWNVAISSGDSSDHVMGARLDATGATLDPSGILIGTTYATNIKTAFGAGQYAVAWNRILSPDYTVHLALLSPATGAVTPPESVTPFVVPGINSPTQTSPALTWNGASFQLVWADTRNGGDIYGARVDPTLASLDGKGLLVSGGANAQQNAAMAYNGTHYLAAWEDKRAATTEIWATRVDPDGITLDHAGIKVSGDVGDRKLPAVASNGDGFFVVWQDTRNGSDDIYGTPVTAAGAVVAPAGVPISTPTSTQQTPAVAFDGAQYLAVWSDARSASTWDIYGARVTAAGTLLDPNGIAIYAGAANQLDPTVASNGSGALVAWTDSRAGNSDVYAARVSKAGAVLDPAGFGVAITTSAETLPALASDGSDYLAVFQIGGDLRATRVTAAGAPIAPLAFVVSNAAGTQQNQAATFDGLNYLVAWDDGTDTRGARVSRTGTLLDTSGFAISTTSTFPAIAGGPYRRALVAYHRFDATSAGAQRVRKRVYDDRLSLGGSCAVAGDCLSGFCTDGVCCASACSGTCMACSFAKTNAANGTCAPIKDGTDPDGECVADSLSCTTAACVAGACGQVAAANTCVIGGLCVAAGATAPGNDCAACTPATSTSAFTPRANGTACASDGLACTTDTCQAGVCSHAVAAGQCLIDGVCRAAGTTSPFDPCSVCDPAASTTAWTPKASGSACPDDGLACTADVCQAGVCTHAPSNGACVIDGSCVTAGATDPFDACKACDATTSTTAWSPRANGSACADDALGCTADVCQGGICQHTLAAGACLIGGSCRTAGEANPLDDCAACDPLVSTTAWTPKPDGAACAPDAKSCTLDVCQAGVCAHPQAPSTCLIGGECWSAGDKNPGNACETCSPADSASAWSPVVPCGPPDAGTGGSGGTGTGSGGSDAGATGGGGAGTGGTGTGGMGAGGSGGGTTTATGGSDAGSAQVCVPGAQIACACDGGPSGVQVCAADGSAYGACDCKGPSGSGGGMTTGPKETPDSGCGCDVPGGEERGAGRAGAGALALLALVVGRRRRDRSKIGR